MRYINQTNITTHEEHHESLYKAPVEVIVLLLILILITGLIGNAIVVLIVVKKRRMQTFTNWLILNLSVADLLVALFCIPLEIPLELTNYKWMYGKMFCTLFYPIQTTTIYGSVFTLMALSLSRFWAIIHPFRKQPTVTIAKISIGIIWLCSILLVVPYMTVLHYNKDDQSCAENWTVQRRRTYTVIIFIIQFVIPLGVISVAYIWIVYELCYKTENKQCMLRKDKAKQKETKKVVKLLLVISVTFAVCILPYHVVALVAEFGDSTQIKYFADISLGSYLILYINSAINPIIYNVFNERFRESFSELYKTLVACICTKNIDMDGIGFFSSRRPSKFDFNGSFWNRMSLSQSISDPTSVTTVGNRGLSANFLNLPTSLKSEKRTQRFLSVD